MVKVIDTDKLFDDYIKDYVYENIGKVNPEEIENKMPVLYEEFGDKKLKELDDKSPNEYYQGFSACELLECLKSHIDLSVPVSDFLVEAITQKPDAESVAIKLLMDDLSEEFTLYLMNILSDLNSEKATLRYMEFILSDYSETIKELATESLTQNADLVKDAIIENYAGADDITKARFTEILSNAKRDDKVFEILVNAFLSNPDQVQIYANYLAKYGDERALPFLETAIEKDKISYADFEELRFAIEALGGEVNIKKDFSKDGTFKKITAKPDIN